MYLVREECAAHDSLARGGPGVNRQASELNLFWILVSRGKI